MQAKIHWFQSLILRLHNEYNVRKTINSLMTLLVLVLLSLISQSCVKDTTNAPYWNSNSPIADSEGTPPPITPPIVGTNYFNWDVETQKVSYGINGLGTFNVSPYNTTTIINDPVICHKSSHWVKMQVIGNDGGNQGLGIDTSQQNPSYPWKIIGGRSMYYRSWVKYSVGYNWGVPGVANVKTERGFVDTIQNRLITMHMRSNGFLIAECEFVSGYGGCCLARSGQPNNDYDIKIPYDVQGKADGLWHEYITRIKPNTGPNTMDAEFQVWVDGVSVGQLSGWRFTSNTTDTWRDAWGGWMVTSYFQMNGDTTVGGIVWTDDFSVDDAWNSMIPASPFN